MERLLLGGWSRDYRRLNQSLLHYLPRLLRRTRFCLWTTSHLFWSLYQQLQDLTVAGHHGLHGGPLLQCGHPRALLQEGADAQGHS